MMRNIVNKKQAKYFRQGDILLKRVNGFDTKNLVETKDRTVALGEMTGHHHTFGSGQVLLYKKHEQAVEPEYIVVKKQAELTHQEHLPLIVPEGEYQVVKEQEFNPWLNQLTQVRD